MGDEINRRRILGAGAAVATLTVAASHRAKVSARPGRDVSMQIMSPVGLTFKPPTTKAPPPTTALICLIDLVAPKPTGSSVADLEIYFANIEEISITDIAPILVNAARGDYSKKIGKKNPKDKFKSPLTLKNPKDNYLVYILSDRNWQFSDGVAGPIRVGIYDEANNNVENEGVYYQVERAPAAPGRLPRVASMIAYASKVAGGTGYVHSINLNVDLMFKDQNGVLTPMPIIIDPDIRNPGGAKP